MNFSTPSKVQQVIRTTDDAAAMQSKNRTNINNAANCFPPLDEKTAEQVGLKINVNFGELMELLAEARRQFMTAFWNQQYFFKVTLPAAPRESQSEWGAAITEFINQPIRDSLNYFELHRSRWSAVVCHGIGPQSWWDDNDWHPSFVGLPDIRIPTDTTQDCKNLDWWAVRRMFTVGELIDEVFSKRSGNNWNKKAMARILKNYKESNSDYGSNKYNWETDYEKLAELIKQDGGWYASSAMPGIPLWYFYFKDDTERGNEGIFLRVVPETGNVKGAGADSEDFLWQSDKPVARRREHVLHMQFGDLNNDAPFKIPSIRSLGFALLEPTWYNNLTICRATQHLHDSFNILLRLTDPTDRARATIQELANLSVLKPGVDIVPAAQRHQVNPALIETVMGTMKQLQSEKSSSYTQAADTGTQKEQTAFETRVKVERVNAMTAGILLNAFMYAGHEYREICRRFCLRKTRNDDIEDFLKNCKGVGIPGEWVDVKRWKVEPVTPLGMGNPTIAQSAAQQLMNQRGAYSPEAQQEILHESTLVITGDARKARRLAPINQKPTTTTGGNFAASIFGTLMQGVPVQAPQDVSPEEQIKVLLPMLAGVISKFAKRNMASQDEVQGMATVSQYITGLLQRMSTDPVQKQKVKQYSDMLGRLTNEIKALAQRGQEAMKKQAQIAANGNGKPNGDGGPQGKIAEKLILAKATGDIKKATARQNLIHKEQAFQAEERRKNLQAVGEMHRSTVKQGHEMATNRIRSLMEPPAQPAEE